MKYNNNNIINMTMTTVAMKRHKDILLWTWATISGK
jgi:hypothetical protein